MPRNDSSIVLSLNIKINERASKLFRTKTSVIRIETAQILATIGQTYFVMIKM